MLRRVDDASSIDSRAHPVFAFLSPCVLLAALSTPLQPLSITLPIALTSVDLDACTCDGHRIILTGHRRLLWSLTSSTPLPPPSQTHQQDMADASNDVDLDSVIDRLLEGTCRKLCLV